MPLPQLNPKRKAAFILGLVLETAAAYGFIGMNDGSIFMIIVWGVATILTYIAIICFVMAFSTIRISKILIGAVIAVLVIYAGLTLMRF